LAPRYSFCAAHRLVHRPHPLPRDIIFPSFFFRAFTLSFPIRVCHAQRIFFLKSTIHPRSFSRVHVLKITCVSLPLHQISHQYLTRFRVIFLAFTRRIFPRDDLVDPSHPSCPLFFHSRRPLSGNDGLFCLVFRPWPLCFPAVPLPPPGVLSEPLSVCALVTCSFSRLLFFPKKKPFFFATIYDRSRRTTVLNNISQSVAV